MESVAPHLPADLSTSFQKASRSRGSRAPEWHSGVLEPHHAGASEPQGDTLGFQSPNTGAYVLARGASPDQHSDAGNRLQVTLPAALP